MENKNTIEKSIIVLDIVEAIEQFLIASKEIKTIIDFEEKDNIITTVEDNGGGIKVKPIEKIFEPFCGRFTLNTYSPFLFVFAPL